MIKDRKQNEPQPGGASNTDNRNNRSSTSPAHWQGEPLPRDARNQTQEIGFDERGAGRASQYGRAGTYGKAHQQRESRPQRGETVPDDVLLKNVQDAFHQSGLNIADVLIHVEKGVVRLKGYVQDPQDQYALERFAVNCEGTVTVENQLETSPRAAPDPTK